MFSVPIDDVGWLFHFLLDERSEIVAWNLYRGQIKMSLSAEDQFAEKFALYLAVGLLGPTRVIEYLDDDKRRERPAVPMYWRSKLLIPGSSGLLYSCRGSADSTSTKLTRTKILFFDFTFEFDKKLSHGEAGHNKTDLQSSRRPSSPRVFVSLGFFLLMERGSEAEAGKNAGTEIAGGHYVSTQPLDYTQIVSYMNSLQLDRASVNPEKLASSMAEDLLRLGSSSSKKIDVGQKRREETQVLTVDYSSGINEENREVKSKLCSDQSQNLDDFSSICVTIPCKSMGDANGKLKLKHSSSGVSKFDSSALRFLSWDFSKNPNNFENAAWANGESLLSKKDLVDEAFDRWQMQVKTSTSDDKKGKQSSDNPDVSTATVDSSRTRNIDRNKKQRSFKGFGVLPSARRKRNKGLVYDTK